MAYVHAQGWIKELRDCPVLALVVGAQQQAAPVSHAHPHVPCCSREVPHANHFAVPASLHVMFLFSIYHSASEYSGIRRNFLFHA